MKNSLKFILFISLMVTAFGSSAKSTQGADVEAMQNLLDATDGKAQISIDNESGLARSIRLPQSTLGTSIGAGKLIAPAQQRAIFFLRAYGNAFGVSDTNAELQAVGTTRDTIGYQHAIFKQKFKGIPVFGGELRAHFDLNDDLFLVNGTFVSKINVNTKPALSADIAGERAVRAVMRTQFDNEKVKAKKLESLAGRDENRDGLKAASTKLMVFREGLLRGAPGMDHLAYEVEVTNTKRTVREFVYIDAHSGKVIDQITGIHDALTRRAYDGDNLPTVPPSYPGTPFWVEGDALPTGTTEADNMIYASGETYDMFVNGFGRDSFDGGGATMDSIFNRGYGCPNASWNGIFISFCPGFTTDDITGHEWGHAYTEYTNNLIYQWQSGALNESYSDIWGETLDKINNRGVDTPDNPRTTGGCSAYSGGPADDDSIRWLMGEELGALRDMWNPTCNGDPGKVTDSEYWCTTGDSGGVHFNSGVPNRAYSLMVDGGDFNGYSVTGLGLTKSAHIHWAAQNLLTPASNFVDQADALEAACSSLVGVDLNDLATGASSGEVITAADCDQVADVNAAVEFRTPPDQCGFVSLLEPDAPALCENLGSAQTVYLEGFEAGTLPAGWTASSHDVANPSTFDSPGWTIETGLPSGNGSSYAAFAPDLAEGDCAADTEAGVVNLDSPAIALPAGKVPHVAFDHWVSTEAGWDGGNVKVSVNGGPWTLVPASAYTFNPYNAVLTISDNPLGGQEGYTGGDGGSNSGSWGQSQVNLYGLAVPGDTVRLRFDFGTDGCNGVTGWYVDDVHAYTCSAEALPICGDGHLDALEACDDGNMADGDGCSSVCQVESGWTCADPVPSNPNGVNIIGDWSFEGGYPNADWTPASSSGLAADPLCDPLSCGPDLANTGEWYVWVGGFSTGVSSSVEQTIEIPATATELTIQALRGLCSPSMSDVLHVSLDGTDIGSLVCDGTDGGYVEHSFSVAGFNDGGTHTLFIGGTATGDGTTWTNFFVDDVVLSDNVATPAMPSVCEEIVVDLACNAGTVGFDEGISPSWSVVDNAGNGVVWTDISSSEIGGNFTSGSGEAPSVNSDANAFVEYDTELVSNSFSLQNPASASLDFLANYRDLSTGEDTFDVDISTDGGSSWTNLLTWDDDYGGFYSGPGVLVSIDLAAYLGEPEVQLRWHYYNEESGDWDWYAQIDDVALTSSDDADCDGVVDSLDFCPGTMISESVPTDSLGKNRWALTDGDNVFDTNGKSSAGYTLQDTGGCSCEQIIDNLGLGLGHTKYGCSSGALDDWIDQLSQ